MQMIVVNCRCNVAVKCEGCVNSTGFSIPGMSANFEKFH